MKNNTLSKKVLLLSMLTISAVFLFASLDFSIASASKPLSLQPSQSNSLVSEEGEEEESNVILVIEIVIGLLLISSLVGIVTERLRVPYTAGLVVIGLVLALVGRIDINVSPELFLGLLVPPLIFEAAFQVGQRGFDQVCIETTR